MKEGDTVEGRYRIIRQLDQGGMGSVFLAEHVLIKRRVAIKVLKPELAEDADVIERFMNEARAAGTLGHPNIVESTDMGFTREGVPYIVFEYLEGSLLTDEIYRVGGMPVRRAVRIARQIASALNAAHHAGVIHRDLKTDNVFLTDKEEASDHVKVLDFGISRFLEAEDDRSGARSLVMGTPQFMAPEQITEPDKVDRRADIYALGVIIYEMITARRPFTNDDTDALINDILNTPPPPLDVADVPAGLQEMLFTKMLSKNRADRYSTMRDVEGALEAFAGVLRDGRESKPIPVMTPSDVSEAHIAAANLITLPAAPQRRSGAIWLVAALIAGGAGGALMYLDGQTRAVAGDDLAVRMAALQGGADAVGAAIDSTLKGLQLRAQGIAQTPMLRSAVETDAATVKDMVGSDFLFTPGKGEVFELIQLRDGVRSMLLRIPAAAPALPLVGLDDSRIVSDGPSLLVTFGSSISSQKGAIAGVVALQAPVDLAAAARTLTPLVIEAKLTGFGPPLTLVAGAASTDPTSTIVLPLTAKGLKADGAKLELVQRAVGTKGPTRTYALARNASWSVGGLLLVVYFLLLLKGRTRG
ncbi:MAG: serine/threonine protein kinase [Myxococcales bacterium]|nr:serine/threonine protein kinase [Myxococcales bacterium]